ncbi:MAG: hypothetical protein AAGL34_19650, partial [Bacteroidota bacterium]
MNDFFKSNLENELGKFPNYSSYLFDKNLKKQVHKELVLLKELSYRIFEILLIKSSFIPYIYFITLRFINVSFSSIE